jgi:hypothetical protein
MDSKPNWENTAPTIRDLYPGLSESDLKRAEANLTRYLEIAFEVCQELASKNDAVDTSNAAPTIKERSKSSYEIQ